MKIHIVQKGDTLWKIAKKYGVNFETLKKMNSQLSNPDMLMPGMKIKIPDTTSPSVKKGGNTKINFGTVKEVPISGGSSNVKESIKAETEAVPSKPKEMPIVSPPPAVKEMPIQPMDIKKEKPVKEKPKMPYVAPQAIVKPVVPEIDINNYYLMNMAKMEMQTPPPMPIIKEIPKVKEKPVIKEKPKKMEKPMPKPQPMPMPKPQPMPQYMPEYCPPMIPYYDPCCPPVMMHPCMAYPTPYFNQSYMTGPAYQQPYMQQPYWGYDDDFGDSSTFHHGYHDSSHFMGNKGGYYPQHQGGSMSSHGHYPVQGTQGYFQQPGFGHHGHESSHYGMESSNHMMDYHHHKQQQQQYIPFDGYIPKGCGCSDTGTQGTFYQPMNQYDHQGMSHSMGQYDHQGMGHSMGQHDQQGMGHSMGQYDQQGTGQQMGQYDHQGMGQQMDQYDHQGMSQSMNQLEQQGMSQPMGQFGQQGMTNPMYQQAAQQPFFQDSQFHQRYGGQQFEAGSPSYNPNGQHVIPHIEPAAFDMPRTQEESSEQEGQS